VTDSAANLSDCHYFLDIWLLENTHENVHDRSPSDLFGAVEKPAAKFDDEAMLIFDKEGISLLAKMPMVSL